MRPVMRSHMSKEAIYCFFVKTTPDILVRRQRYGWAGSRPQLRIKATRLNIYYLAPETLVRTAEPARLHSASKLCAFRNRLGRSFSSHSRALRYWAPHRSSRSHPALSSLNASTCHWSASTTSVGLRQLIRITFSSAAVSVRQVITGKRTSNVVALGWIAAPTKSTRAITPNRFILSCHEIRVYWAVR